MVRQIRLYEDRDLNSVLAAWENASRLAHPFLTEAFLERERDAISTLYLPNAETWVIEQQQTVIGFIALIGNEIGGLFVLPEFHGTGAGRALMDRAKTLHGEVEVEVFEQNAIGRGFYAKCGFVPVEEKVHEETGHVMLRLRFTPDR